MLSSRMAEDLRLRESEVLGRCEMRVFEVGRELVSCRRKLEAERMGVCRNPGVGLGIGGMQGLRDSVRDHNVPVCLATASCFLLQSEK